MAKFSVGDRVQYGVKYRLFPKAIFFGTVKEIIVKYEGCCDVAVVKWDNNDKEEIVPMESLVEAY